MISKSQSSPCVGMVMLQYNRYDLTCLALDAVKQIAYDNMVVILVDNGSEDNSLEQLKDKYGDWIVYEESNHRISYSEAYNVGFKKALELGAKYVHLTHNDSYDYSPNYLDEIVKAFESDDSIALVGSRVMSPEGHVDWGGENRAKFGIDMDTPTCGYAISKDSLEKVGYLDETLGVYFEDLDYLKRLRDKGFRTQYVDSVSYVHMGSGTIIRTNYDFHFLRMRNIFWFFKKHGQDYSMALKFRSVFGLGWKYHLSFFFAALKKRMIFKALYILYANIKGSVVGLLVPYRPTN